MTASPRPWFCAALVLLLCLCLAAPALAGGKDEIPAGNRAAPAGKFKTAISHYGKAIEAGDLSPANMAVAYNNRGSANDDLGRRKAALADFARAIKLQPDYAETYYNRSFTYEKMGQYKKALADAKKAVALRPKDQTYLQREYYLATKQK
ncbi:MAG: tetratricopeptide repeat protein [Desulfarculaceae bacterium]|nr:tetratricopeptide repeat protein [Desulfarculaceae bacterium]